MAINVIASNSFPLLTDNSPIHLDLLSRALCMRIKIEDQLRKSPSVVLIEPLALSSIIKLDEMICINKGTT